MDDDRTIYTITYDGEPYCVVSAVDERAALHIAEGFLGYELSGADPKADHTEREIARPPEDQIARLAAREPTDGERARFQSHQFADNREIALAAVMLPRSSRVEPISR